MPRPPKYPKLLHVKYVHSKGNVYAYFNTGKTKANGNAIYVRLPHPSTTGFFDSYAAMKGARTKREAVGYLVIDLVRDYEASMESAPIWLRGPRPCTAPPTSASSSC